jgi:hypothetical protein
MFTRVALIACTALPLWAAPADAQPLFRRERNWTVEVGGRTYGLCDVVQTPGDFRWPEVWIAGRPFNPTHRPADQWVLAVPPLTAVLTVRHLTRPPARPARP